jgi:Glu-tRNA(Gln) amidotransferase subunit E-like FAD-binding protein
MAIPLPGFQGLLEASTQPRTSFLKEFSDRIRVIACLDELPNLALSTQDMPTLSSGEWERVSKLCSAPADVPVLVVWGRAQDTATAITEIALRARDATRGVPQETRQALDDGTNGFERILPGADRMYPDTDLPPIPLADERVAAIRDSLPLRPWERLALLQQWGVGADLAERLSRHRAWDLFAALVTDPPAPAGPTPHQLASLLLDRSCPRPASLGAAETWWRRTLADIGRGETLLEGVWLAEDEVPARLPEAEARAIARRLLTTLPAGRPAAGPRLEAFAMAHVMATLRGQAAGRDVRRWLQEELA